MESSSGEQKTVLDSRFTGKSKYQEQSPHFFTQESSDYTVTLFEKPISYCMGIVDMVNSTQLAASLGMTYMSKYYQYFLNFMSKIIAQYDGKVVKNIGDCLLFYFPRTVAQDIREMERILECSHAMTLSRETLCSILKLERLPCIDYRISLDYGQVMPMRSTGSKSLDMIGPVVNMCSKINRCAERNSIVVGGDLFEIVKHSRRFAFKEVKDISVGFKHCYPVYSVIAR